MASIETKEAVILALKNEYIENSDVCMYDFLATEGVPADLGLTYEDVVEIYAELMNWSDGDMMYRENKEDGFRYDIINNVHIDL